jgi:hypothetical protein
MAKPIRLKKLLRRDAVAAVVTAVSHGEDAVVDAKGRLLAGPELDGAGIPVTEPGGTTLGHVTGPHAAATAETLSALVRFEQERRELADEVLDMYREVNLLYALGEVLATARDRTDLASRTVREATRHVAVDEACLVVTVDGLEVLAATGSGGLRIPGDLGRLRIDSDQDGSLLVAPLAFRGTQRGALLLRRDHGTFEAGDLKLTGAVASQSASVLGRILDEERRAKAAAEREQSLRRQLDQLRIELDLGRQAEQVEQVTETDYFGGLRAQASHLRRIIGDGQG